MHPTLLLAATSKDRKVLIPALCDDFHLIEAATSKQAFRNIGRQKPDAILCTLLFDESRMFDFLKDLKDNPETATIPFITCRAIASQLPEDVIKKLDIVSMSFGAVMFLDFLLLFEQGRQSEAVPLIKKCLSV